MSILIFCTESFGGLADYAHFQAEALAVRGHPVLLLAPAGFPFHSLHYRLEILPRVTVTLKWMNFRWLQQLATAATIFWQQRSLNRAIDVSGSRFVLFTSYSEYLAPFWAGRLRGWTRKGIQFAAVVHDPVRDYVVGPLWWHRFSIAEGYSFLSLAFVHAPIDLSTVRPQPQLRTIEIPHGPYPFPSGEARRDEVRLHLGVPEQATLLLSFGHLRDSKNLSLLLKAMVHVPQIWLLVAGPEATAGQWPSSQYQRLAERLGVAERCHWRIGYQPTERVGELFAASDGVLLTYAARFRSASGVLHLAGHYRVPVLASAGDGSMLNDVCRFDLGEVVTPDDLDALIIGLRRFHLKPFRPDWDGYERASSWDRNAQLVATYFGLESQPGATTP
ncbi:glycosyltransferase [Synechococcus sp. CBW1107]|uniref:glycosyltransferase n=1 Tax=Synechococcus sp. CBW1107 TaxID=2789857 RepID=UPI002AD39AD2|nr:glycosyltransferase [Synechococcus sp. CBW1107]CAK6687004.1 hypothetical protein ICNINCKA_00115 [Synechococcus sp. CBW1107]